MRRKRAGFMAVVCLLVGAGARSFTARVASAPNSNTNNQWTITAV